MKVDERTTALQLLLEIERQQSYSNLLLRQRLREKDARFAARVTALVYGVLERRVTLDALIAHYTKKPASKLDLEVRMILQLGFYQLLYQDAVPDNAAVNETVKLCYAVKKVSAKGLVNAILRRFVREGKKLPLPNDAVRAASMRYACPEWLVRRWQKAYGKEEAERLMASSFGPAPLTVRVNTQKTTTEALTKKLEEAGVLVTPVQGFPHALHLAHTGNVEKLPGFSDGEFYVQDLSSQICAMVSGVQPGDVVYDLCAAPGSKSFTMALEMRDEGAVYAYDQYPHKIRLIEEGAQKLGLTSIHAALSDAAVWEENRPLADVVLCDVPCGGLGILRRKPEIRMKKPESIDSLAPLQRKILETGARYVKPGGRLVYATCSLNPVENEDAARAFLAAHPEFEPAKIPDFLQAARVEGSMVTIFPHHFGSDGFFFAVFTRTKQPKEESFCRSSN